MVASPEKSNYGLTMFTRNREHVNDPSLSATIKEAREILRHRGWSYRSAAPLLGVTYQHLAQVLTGRRESRRLIEAIHSLPHRSEVER